VLVLVDVVDDVISGCDDVIVVPVGVYYKNISSHVQNCLRFGFC